MEIDYDAIRKCLENDSRIVQLPAKGQAVFVGDTHGDIDAIHEVLDLLFKPGYMLVFLGDYVNRDAASRENISLLLEKKLEAPDRPCSWETMEDTFLKTSTRRSSGAAYQTKK